jgi:hypothetical protein
VTHISPAAPDHPLVGRFARSGRALARCRERLLSDRTTVGSRATLVWLFVRLPMIALLLYWLRQPILDVIERQFDIFHITRFVIDLLSTPVTRLVVGVALLGALLLVATFASRLRPVQAYAILLVTAGALIALLFELTATSLRRGLVAASILAVNLAPSQLLGPLKRFERVWDAFMVAGVGVAELFLFREYSWWLRRRLYGDRRLDRGGDRGVAPAIPGVLLTSLAVAFLIRGERLLPFEQMFRMSAGVQVIERLSFNWIELDSSRTHLYTTGHGLPRLRRYDVRDLSRRPMISDSPTGGSQGFAYDPQANEIYAFNIFTRQLLYLHAATLERKRVVELPDLSPGDPWIAVDRITNTLTVVSEADRRVGAPFIVLDRASGRVLERHDLDAGNVLAHPTKPWLYLSFFRRRNQLLLYDLQSRSVTHRAPADARAERMAFWDGANELLVTSPVEGRIMRFDADRLLPKGYISAPWGVRAIAVDEQRDLLVCGTIATGYVVVMDLRSGKWLRRYYLGPWLRTIQLHVERGAAYVSSNGALYRLEYASPLAE